LKGLQSNHRWLPHLSDGVLYVGQLNRWADVRVRISLDRIAKFGCRRLGSLEAVLVVKVRADRRNPMVPLLLADTGVALVNASATIAIMVPLATTVRTSLDFIL